MTLPESMVPADVEEGRSLRTMISDAVSKSKGQGVVHGSTVFFRDLAESVAHSNRNLKIGLAFLTAGFVIVTGSLGYLVVVSLKGQESDRQRMEKQYQELDGRLREALRPFIGRNEELAKRLASVEVEHRREIDALKSLNQAQIDAARQETQKAQEQVRKLQLEVGKWTEGATEIVKDHENRIRSLEKKGK